MVYHRGIGLLLLSTLSPARSVLTSPTENLNTRFSRLVAFLSYTIFE